MASLENRWGFQKKWPMLLEVIRKKGELKKKTTQTKANQHSNQNNTLTNTIHFSFVIVVSSLLKHTPSLGVKKEHAQTTPKIRSAPGDPTQGSNLQETPSIYPLKKRTYQTSGKFGGKSSEEKCRLKRTFGEICYKFPGGKIPF